MKCCLQDSLLNQWIKVFENAPLCQLRNFLSASLFYDIYINIMPSTFKRFFLVPKVASSCFPETVLMKHDYIALIHCCPIEEIQCNYNGIYYYRKCNSAHKKMSTNYSVFFISVFLIDRSGLWDHKGLTVTTLLDIWYECSMFALLLKYIIIQFYRELIS